MSLTGVKGRGNWGFPGGWSVAPLLILPLLSCGYLHPELNAGLPHQAALHCPSIYYNQSHTLNPLPLPLLLCHVFLHQLLLFCDHLLLFGDDESYGPIPPRDVGTFGEVPIQGPGLFPHSPVCPTIPEVRDYLAAGPDVSIGPLLPEHVHDGQWVRGNVNSQLTFFF